MRNTRVKINYPNLLIILMGALIILLSFHFGKFNIVAKDISNIEIKDISIDPINSGDLTKKGSEVSFQFTPKRDNVSGIILYGNKYNYIYFEENASLNLEISYTKNDQDNYYKKYVIPIEKLRGKIFKIEFDPLSECKNVPVLVKIVSNQDLTSPGGVLIRNDDSTKILYKVNFADFLEEITNEIDKDQKFFRMFFWVMAPLILFILFLSVFNFKNEP